MQKVNDIRQYKNELRIKYKKIRQELSVDKKSEYDEKIFQKTISLEKYKNSELVMTFVSTDIEVDTKKLIEYSLSIGKKVAVPKCVDGTRDMEFYLINSFDDLEVATFSVLEPKTDKCEKIDAFNNSICIVPGLIFDVEGYRLGYGKGYYDRFLSKYKGTTVGICYSNCIVNQLIHGRYDLKVKLLVTDKYIKSIDRGI